MRCLSRTPSSVLTPFVSSIFWFEGEFDHARELALPHGGAQLTVNMTEDEQRHYDGPGYRTVHRLPAATLVGPGSRPMGIDTDEQRVVVGVGFRPGGAYPFFALPAAATVDAHLPLSDLWGTDGATLRERLLCCPTPEARLRTVEVLLLTHAVRALRPDPLVCHAMAGLERGVRVAELADRLGVTARLLCRRFLAQVGHPPKRYARIRRFQRVLAEVAGASGPVNWARLAAGAGYVDQSHLIHDFREFAGVTPGGYRPRGATEHNHLPLSLFSNP